MPSLTMEPNADLAPYHARQMAVLTLDQRRGLARRTFREDEILRRSRQGLSRSCDTQPLRFSRCWTGLRPVGLVLARCHLDRNLLQEMPRAGGACSVMRMRGIPSAFDGASASPIRAGIARLSLLHSGSQLRHAADVVLLQLVRTPIFELSLQIRRHYFCPTVIRIALRCMREE